MAQGALTLPLLGGGQEGLNERIYNLERPHLNPPLRGEEGKIICLPLRWEEKEGLQGGQEGRVSAE